MSVWRHDGMLDAGATISPQALGVILTMVTFDPKLPFEPHLPTLKLPCVGLEREPQAMVNIGKLSDCNFLSDRSSLAFSILSHLSRASVA